MVRKNRSLTILLFVAIIASTLVYMAFGLGIDSKIGMSNNLFVGLAIFFTLVVSALIGGVISMAALMDALEQLVCIKEGNSMGYGLVWLMFYVFVPLYSWMLLPSLLSIIFQILLALSVFITLLTILVQIKSENQKNRRSSAKKRKPAPTGQLSNITE